jgi:hypothetical protein
MIASAADSETGTNSDQEHIRSSQRLSLIDVFAFEVAVALPAFAIGEWLECPKCGLLCDAPFQPFGSDADEPELVLGSSLPESDAVPLVAGRRRGQMPSVWHLYSCSRSLQCTLRSFAPEVQKPG